LVDYFSADAKILEGFVVKDVEPGHGTGRGYLKFASLTEAENMITTKSGRLVILGVTIRLNYRQIFL